MTVADTQPTKFRLRARKARGGTFEYPSPPATPCTPGKRPEESGRGSHECLRHIAISGAD
ncbi:MAG TPA: hypothetical protein VMH81_12235 [Bryobacteraceae bacterium]|nr:hypothetical protein [Bryobacteraceae bacterium]